MGVDVVELQPPGKISEREFAVHAATEVDGGWPESCPARFRPLDSAHGVREGAPLSEVHRNSGPGHNVVLLHAGPVKAAAIQNNSQVCEAMQREHFHRAVPSAEG